MVEYALILSFISVVAMSVLIALGGQVKGVFSAVTSQFASAGNSGSSGSGSPPSPPPRGG